ncbi:MAG: hypothetical protein A2157_00195 [Deltaproteobacteria bacterium RBG_16_47_11]|nr:MAG: hypothetical protein A2157_00195 [Deltaproteobacteria bacterium RBG_16_47_11]
MENGSIEKTRTQSPVVNNKCHLATFIESNISLKMILDNHQGTKIYQTGLNIARDWFRVY